MAESPVVKEVKRQVVYIACVLALTLAAYISYSGLNIGNLLTADVSTQASPEPRYFAYRCVRDQKIPIEKDWKGNVMSIESSLEASVAFDRRELTISTKGTGMWFDNLENGVEKTSMWNAKIGYMQSVKITTGEVFGEEIEIDATTSPPRRSVYEQIIYDRAANTLKMYLVSNKAENRGDVYNWYCAASGSEALNIVRAKWHVVDEPLPKSATVSTPTNSTPESVRPNARPPEAVPTAAASPAPPTPTAAPPLPLTPAVNPVVGYNVIVRCGDAKRYIKSGSDYPEIAPPLQRGDVITNAVRYTHTNGSKWFKGRVGNVEVYVAESDVLGRDCNDASN